MEEFIYYNPEHVNLRRPDSGYVPLHIACNHNHLDMVKFILETVCVRTVLVLALAL